MVMTMTMRIMVMTKGDDNNDNDADDHGGAEKNARAHSARHNAKRHLATTYTKTNTHTSTPKSMSGRLGQPFNICLTTDLSFVRVGGHSGRQRQAAPRTAQTRQAPPPPVRARRPSAVARPTVPCTRNRVERQRSRPYSRKGVHEPRAC